MTDSSIGPSPTRLPPTANVLYDAEFIQEHYKSYFLQFNILQRCKDKVVFSLIPVNDSTRTVIVSLSDKGFFIQQDSSPHSQVIGKLLESIEQVFTIIMGPTDFTNLLLGLTADRLNSS